MSRLDELLTHLCPEGTQFKALAEIGTLYGGLTGKSKVDFADGNAPFVTYMNVFNNLATNISPDALVRIGASERQNRVRYGDVLFTASSESAEEVGLASAVTVEPPEPLYLNSFCFGLRLNAGVDLDPEFAKHLFRSAEVRKQITRTANGVTRINISKARFRAVRIPVPPLEVQREAARILDRFAELEAALEAELEARLRQRMGVDAMLRSATSVASTARTEWERVPLGSFVTQSVEPLRVSRDEWYVSLGVKWYGEGAFAREPKLGSTIKAKTLYRVRAGQFIYNRMFVTEGSFGLITPELADGVVSNEFPVFDVDQSRALPEWLFLKFQDPATVRRAAAETTGGTKSRRRWKESQFLAFKIDLPPLAVQSEIVRVLRAFGDLESELAAELAARRKQYIYYRDRLLTFAEAA